MRPSGCLQVAGVPFIVAWIIAWGIGEVFMLQFLLRLMGVPVGRMELPVVPNEFQPFVVIASIFLVLFLALWTRGGVMAIGFLLQLLLGHDSIVFSPTGWRLERSFGFFSMTRDFEGWSAELHGAQKRLFARRGRKRKAVTPFGTAEELERVRDEIARRYRRGGELPDGFHQQRTVDGAVVITSDTAPGAVNCGMFTIMVWNIPFFFLMMWGVAAFRPAVIVGSILSIATTALALWCFFAQRSWIVGPDTLEERLSAFGAAKKRRFGSGSQLALDAFETSDGVQQYTLRVIDPGRRAHTIYRTFHDSHEIALFARVLQRHTGWRLSDPKKLTLEH